MVKMQCRTCRSLYHRPKNAPYKKTCPPCYKKKNTLPLTDSDKSLVSLNEEYIRLTTKYTTLKAKYEALIHTHEVSLYREPDDFSQNVKSLLLLCHPDKHHNSPISTEITQWLLSKRSKSV